ncbi:hypothetical protein NEIRO02_2347 [Nematocida sp. AWRm79]|nr:hypothetical protein NEIRO02_2347 [Nematocida sp. AWRm79]
MENRKIPEKLINLAGNIYYIQMHRQNAHKEKTGSCQIKGLIKEMSLKHANIAIDIIMKAAKELDSKDKKEAFYELMGNNHVIMAAVYKIRNEFFDSAIDVLCEKEGLPELDIGMPSEYAMIKLCELTDSGECSRLQRALDILMKHGDNLIIIDKNGIEQSNASYLGLSKDDIYSLQLLTRTDKWDLNEFYKFLKESIYGSIHSFYKANEKYIYYFSIYNLHAIIFSIATYIDRNKINKSVYREEKIHKIKESIDELKKANKIVITNSFLNSNIYIMI